MKVKLAVAFVCWMLCTSGLARADSVLTVTVPTTTIQIVDVTASLSFDWDVTTSTVYDVNLDDLSAPFTITAISFFGGPEDSLYVLSIAGLGNNYFQLTQTWFSPVTMPIPPVAGIYDAGFFDQNCVSNGSGGSLCLQGANMVAATVTGPISTPEPSLLLLLAMGLAAVVGLGARLRKMTDEELLRFR